MIWTILCVRSDENIDKDCPGTDISGESPFWIRDTGGERPTKKWNESRIPTVTLPYFTSTGYEINAGTLGLNELSLPSILRHADEETETYRDGIVDEGYGLVQERNRRTLF